MSFKPHVIVAAAALAIFGAGAGASAQTALKVATLAPGAASATAPGSVPAALGAELARWPEGAEFYQARAMAPLWDAAGGRLDAEVLIEALETAPTHALPAPRYGAARLRERLAAGAATAKARAALDVALSRALVVFAQDLEAGALAPRSIDRELHVFPERPSAGFLLAGAATAGDLSAWLAARAPAGPEYVALQAAFAELSELAGRGGWSASVANGGSLRPGASGKRVEQVRARLAELGWPAPAADALEVYDPAMVAAVEAFQRDHGLNADGVIGRRTFAALTTDAGERMTQAAVNLERMRWMPRDLGKRHIYVNQADFSVRMMDGDEVLHASRVVVGQRRKFRTPEFSDEMTHMVVNPTWNVPRSIATKEILPLLQEDPEYLSRKNMRLISTEGAATPDDPDSHDWNQYDIGNFPYRIAQRPGSGNALGKVKFMFPNQFNIYLHDTPSKSLFKRDSRTFSHGCVRVENPFNLAYALLGPQEADPEAAFAGWLDARRERWVNLETPVPVHLTYRTAFMGEDGEIVFRADAYGRDKKVWAAMEKAGVRPL